MYNFLDWVGLCRTYVVIRGEGREDGYPVRYESKVYHIDLFNIPHEIQVSKSSLEESAKHT